MPTKWILTEKIFDDSLLDLYRILKPRLIERAANSYPSKYLNGFQELAKKLSQ
jgi:hypothetical protein